MAQIGGTATQYRRLDSVDWLRGLIIIIMALDHTRSYLGPSLDPTDLAHTTPALFLTRWITHYCAPTFVLLAGTGAYLAGTRGLNRRQLSWFLLTRGLWLVVLELTIIRFVWTFNLDYRWMILQVIWAIGCSMICLSGLVFLPTTVVFLIGALLMSLHNLADGVAADELGRLGPVWKVLHQAGPLRPWPDREIYVAYPLLPWIGVMAGGYSLGAVLTAEPHLRRRRLVVLGLGLTLAFVLLRWSNVYGDPRPWTVQPRGPLFTLFSFLNCQKYPPSLLFLLMTLGPALLLLAAFDRPAGPVGRVLITYGRVPLFFYVWHFALLHFAQLFIRTWARPAGLDLSSWRFDLPEVYVVWLALVAALFGPCRWFAGVKQRRRDWWLSYL